MSVEIKVGQLWRDKDKRRERDGNVREFVVTGITAGMWDDWVAVKETTTGRKHEFGRSRFGSVRANDSFGLVSE
jgi:hypothetical protein